MSAIRYVPLLGRLLIGLPFIFTGAGKATAYGATTAYIVAAGLPFPPLAYAIAVAVELGGGVLLVIGYQTRVVAGVMAVFVLATAFSFHTHFADQNQMINFIKNLMITGGLLQIVAFGAGAFSLDSRRKGGELAPGAAAA